MELLKPYILVAEDDPDDQHLIYKAVTSSKFDINIICRNDGSELIDFLQTCPNDDLPALIVLDYQMPRMSGPEVLQYLFESHRYTQIPKIIWSTSNRPEYVDDCIRWGATNYFLKPSTVEQFDNMMAWIVQTINFQQSMLKV